MVRRRDAYLWRLCSTALSFAAFGLGGFLLGSLVFPLLRVLPGDKSGLRARARAIIHWSMRSFVGFMRVLGVLTYDFRGVSELGRPGQLIVANHPSLIDVVFLLAFTRNAGCVVKHELWRNPVTRGVVSAAAYLSNRSTEGMVREAIEALKEGQCLVMFPEGTRTKPGEPMALHRGAANIALKAARVVTPVYIRVSPTTLTKAEPWYRIPQRRPHFSLRVGKDIDIGKFRATGQIPVMSRMFNDHLREIFELELTKDDA